MKEKNILIACDPLDYILIQKILSPNYYLDRADNRGDILKMRALKEYDLLIIDVIFLKPDFTVITGAKEKKIPVIALSSEPYDARDAKMSQAGCCACYVKPIRKEVFAEFISCWINVN